LALTMAGPPAAARNGRARCRARDRWCRR
jgi:hypothetical protein